MRTIILNHFEASLNPVCRRQFFYYSGMCSVPNMALVHVGTAWGFNYRFYFIKICGK